MESGDRISHYRILGKLGEGGMGVVYRAHDEKLSRPVALKMIRSAQDAAVRERFWREARIAASINHPNVCQIHEIGEENGNLFLVLELLEGQSLGARLESGPLSVAEAVQTSLQMLAALGELHRRGLVHRDLKPANLYLTPHGLKLLDFGLARAVMPDDATLTASGMILGTPRYMAPEQAEGRPATQLSDLFAGGAILYEMLSGRPAFAGNSIPEVLYAVVHRQPPALAGSGAVIAVDRVIQRALAKRPEERYRGASEMADQLRAAALAGDTRSPASARALTRLIVLPFRMLRPDPESEFLAFSLPDAVGSSLSGLESLVVRSSLSAARFSGDAPDLRVIAAEAEVDVVLTGTLLRAGDRLRVSTQLIEVPGGTILHTQQSQGTLHDIFQLQDELVHRIVESLALPLSARETQMLKRDVPAASAYELYLRGNRLYHDWANVTLARDYYLRCLETDPNYAPAWARLGRCYRVITKFGGEPTENLELAEQAFRRALDINPDLALAHNLYAHLETDLGRPRAAMLRLLRSAQSNANDPELFAGLTTVCRYCGLLEASVAAHLRARRLDPGIATSVAHTHFMMGDYQRAYELSYGDIGYIDALSLTMLGRNSEAATLLRERLEKPPPHALLRYFLQILLDTLEGRSLSGLEDAPDKVANFRDPEGIFYWARHSSRSGNKELALVQLGDAVETGYYCDQTLARDPWLDPLRAEPEFAQITRTAETRRRECMMEFVKAGGNRLLGVGM